MKRAATKQRSARKRKPTSTSAPKSPLTPHAARVATNLMSLFAPSLLDSAPTEKELALLRRDVMAEAERRVRMNLEHSALRSVARDAPSD